MSTKQPTNLPIALSEARRQLDHWRRPQPNKRTRLPKEFWQQAVAPAQEHGLNKTARALNVKYDSLKKHLHEAGADEESSVQPPPEFIELLPGPVPPGGDPVGDCPGQCRCDRAGLRGDDSPRRPGPVISQR